VKILPDAEKHVKTAKRMHLDAHVLSKVFIVDLHYRYFIMVEGLFDFVATLFLCIFSWEFICV